MLVSKVIYNGPHFTACEMKGGSLIVTKNRKQEGRCVTGEDASHWINAIKTALDNKEADLICRVILQS